MMRKGMWLAGLLALLVVLPGWCGETTRGPLGRPVRFLSRAEAIRLALDNMAPRCEVRWLGLDGKAGPDSEQLRTAGRLNQILLNVETAYWNLYGAYWNLHSREQGLRQAQDAWSLVCSRYLLGKCGAADVAQIEGQYELYRSQRLTAIDQLLDDERQLRGLLGMKKEDGTRLVPSDTPMLKEIEPDWSAALKETMERRPELQTARRDLTISKCRLCLTKALYAAGRFALTGEMPCDGSRCGNAFRNLPPGPQQWDLGLRNCSPYSSSVASSPCRQAQLQLAKSYLTLQDQELKTERFLGLQYRRIIDTYQQIKAQRAQREAFALQVRLRSQAFQAGRSTADQLLEAQRFCADAMANEYQAIVAYNNSLAAFDFARSRSQDRHHITLCMDSTSKDRAPAGDGWGQEESEDRTACDPSFTLPGLWEKTPPLKDVRPLPQIRELKQGKGLTEQDVDEVLPPPREVDSEIPQAPTK